jgi:hypothetical protein
MSVLRCHKGACLLGSPVLKEVAAELSSILELQSPAVVSVACLSLSAFHIGTQGSCSINARSSPYANFLSRSLTSFSFSAIALTRSSRFRRSILFVFAVASLLSVT